MKLLYIFLAHNRAVDLVELASTLVEASSDAHAIIHFDLNARQADFDELVRNAGEHERLHVVKARTRCRWGRYELVEAVVNAIREAKALAVAFDYAVLLSGDCCPTKPIRQLERYLQANSGREFIECHDESWMVDGLRSERYRFHFPLHPRPNGDTPLFNMLVSLQRRLKVHRKVPGNITMRFGSQWWALTWKTCVAAEELLERQPELVRFFRSTYIPDEMVFPSLVHHLADEERITGFGLTHVQFTNRGRPVVFYDDHGNFPLATPKFFVRKVSPEARLLRERCFQTARQHVADLPSPPIGTMSRAYKLKVEAQTYYPSPGQIFYSDQLASYPQGVFKTVHSPYVVLCGDRPDVRAVLELLPAAYFQRFGFLFRPKQVGLGAGTNVWRGLSRQGWRVRDLHPGLYLARIRRRVSKDQVCVFGWSTGDDRGLLDLVLKDPAGLVVSVPKLTLADSAELAALASLIPVEDWMKQIMNRNHEDSMTIGWSAVDLVGAEAARALAISKEPWFSALAHALRRRLDEQKAAALQRTHVEVSQ